MSLDAEKKYELVKMLYELKQDQKELSAFSTDIDIDIDEYIKKLEDNYTMYNQDNSQDIEPGVLVSWKKGLKNKTKPEYNEPAIVMEVLDTAIIDNDEASDSAYFQEKLNLKIGLLDSDNDLQIFHADKNRFKIFKKD